MWLKQEETIPKFTILMGSPNLPSFMGGINHQSWDGLLLY
jgi:hypothetical protein